MSDVDSTPTAEDIPGIARGASNAADAVKLLLMQICNLYPGDAADHKEELLEIIVSIVRVSLSMHPKQQIELRFDEKESGSALLASPEHIRHLLLQIIGNGKLQPLSLKPGLELGLFKSGKGYVLYITTQVVMFAGLIVWQAPEASAE